MNMSSDARNNLSILALYSLSLLIHRLHFRSTVGFAIHLHGKSPLSLRHSKVPNKIDLPGLTKYQSCERNGSHQLVLPSTKNRRLGLGRSLYSYYWIAQLYCTNLLSSLAASLQVLIAANFALDSHFRQWIAQWVQAKRNDYLIVFDEFSHLSFVG
jgi:hypothetical protein